MDAIAEMIGHLGERLEPIDPTTAALLFAVAGAVTRPGMGRLMLDAIAPLLKTDLHRMKAEGN